MLSEILWLLSEASSVGPVMEDVDVDAVEWAAALHVSLVGLYGWGQAGFAPGTAHCPPFPISPWEGNP